MKIIDNAVMNGYTVAWGGDVSEDGFTRQGLAYAIDTKKTESLQGSDMARWLKMTPAKKRSIIDSLGCTVPEIIPTQQMRQERKAFIAANTMDYTVNKNAIPKDIRKKLGL